MKIHLTKEEFFQHYKSYTDDFVYQLFCHFIYLDIYQDSEIFELWLWNLFDFDDLTYIGTPTREQIQLYVRLSSTPSFILDCETFMETNLAYKRNRILEDLDI